MTFDYIKRSGANLRVANAVTDDGVNRLGAFAMTGSSGTITVNFTARSDGLLIAADGAVFTGSIDNVRLVQKSVSNANTLSVQSSEVGTGYLVKTAGTGAVTVTNLASITDAADTKWNSVAFATANSNTSLSLTGLEDGTYSLYTVASASTVSLQNCATSVGRSSCSANRSSSTCSARGFPVPERTP